MFLRRFISPVSKSLSSPLIVRHYASLDTTEQESISRLIENSIIQEETGNEFQHPDVHQEETTVMMFPGQGTQTVGMMKDLLQYPSVPYTFEVASDILGYDLLRVIESGPQEELDKTDKAQPAIMLTSLAGIQKYQEERSDIIENCRSALGYSVGEFAALVFAGALEFEDAVRLIKVRGRAMQAASKVGGESGMVTAIGKSTTRFPQACRDARYFCKKELGIENACCSVTATLSPNTVTIGGHVEAIDHLRGNLFEYNIRKLINIPVSGAFHTRLMYPAKKDLEQVMRNITIKKPLIDVYSNVTGKKYTNPYEIKRNLATQVVKPIQWEQTISCLVHSLSNEFALPAFYEAGPGSQLGTLLRQVHGKAYRNYTKPSLVKPL